MINKNDFFLSTLSMAFLPQEITRDVLLPWWRAFRTADEEAYLSWSWGWSWDRSWS
jgi:hypothetical protein